MQQYRSKPPCPAACEQSVLMNALHAPQLYALLLDLCSHPLHPDPHLP
jgi:hypothetical protein